ncbi:glycosyltransferase [Wukongibacter baidiensis]|uniref:glycosyltransferase n=1 Tax=Wukongibacter baidiensis TaxID=1723361 RepID=UPI003D7FD02F
MNVLLASMTMDIGGAETHVIELAKGLKKIGHNPIVISAGGIYVQELLADEICHYEAPLNKKDIKSLTESMKVLTRIIDEKKIDLIHAHGRIPALNSKIVSKLKGIPFMTTAHAKFDASLIYKYTSFWGKEVICISEDIKDHLMNNFNVKEEKITIIPNGIDTMKFSPREDSVDLKNELVLGEDTLKVIYISRISGPLAELAKLVIEAGNEIFKENEEIEFIVVGDGDDEDFKRVREAAENVNSEHDKKVVHILGKRTDIPEILSLADVTVCVARTALEAMASEKPVILAGGEGYMGVLTEKNMRDAISNNFTGRTSNDEINIEKLKEEILCLCQPESKKLRVELGKLGREVVMNQFSIQTMVKSTVDIYNKLVKGV